MIVFLYMFFQRAYIVARFFVIVERSHFHTLILQFFGVLVGQFGSVAPHAFFFIFGDLLFYFGMFIAGFNDRRSTPRNDFSDPMTAIRAIGQYVFINSLDDLEPGNAVFATTLRI